MGAGLNKQLPGVLTWPLCGLLSQLRLWRSFMEPQEADEEAQQRQDTQHSVRAPDQERVRHGLGEI